MEVYEAVKLIEDTGMYRVVPVEAVKKNKMILEMANKKQRLTGLPVNIWIDENRTYELGKHSKRIKFQLDNSEKFNLKNSAAIDLNGVMHPEHPKNFQISQFDLTCVKNWVRNNRYALSLIADVYLDLDDIFPFMIKGGEEATAEQIEALKQKCEELRHP